MAIPPVSSDNVPTMIDGKKTSGQTSGDFLSLLSQAKSDDPETQKAVSDADVQGPEVVDSTTHGQDSLTKSGDPVSETAAGKGVAGEPKGAAPLLDEPIKDGEHARKSACQPGVVLLSGSVVDVVAPRGELKVGAKAQQPGDEILLSGSIVDALAHRKDVKTGAKAQQAGDEILLSASNVGVVAPRGDMKVGEKEQQVVNQTLSRVPASPLSTVKGEAITRGAVQAKSGPVQEKDEGLRTVTASESKTQLTPEQSPGTIGQSTLPAGVPVLTELPKGGRPNDRVIVGRLLQEVASAEEYRAVQFLDARSSSNGSDLKRLNVMSLAGGHKDSLPGEDRQAKSASNTESVSPSVTRGSDPRLSQRVSVVQAEDFSAISKGLGPVKVAEHAFAQGAAAVVPKATDAAELVKINSLRGASSPIHPQISSNVLQKLDNVSAPAAPGPVYETETAQSIIDQIARNGELLDMGEKRTITVQLEPEGLGRIEIRATHVDGRVDIQMRASTDFTRDLVQGNLPQLREALMAHAVPFDSLQMSHDGGSGWGAFERRGDSHARRREEHSGDDFASMAQAATEAGDDLNVIDYRI